MYYICIRNDVKLIKKDDENIQYGLIKVDISRENYLVNGRIDPMYQQEGKCS